MLLAMTHRVPAAWRIAAQATASVRVDGLDLDVRFVVDAPEHRRRTALGVTSLGWQELEALAALPYGVAVPWAEVDLRTRLVLDMLPGNVVSKDRHTAMRVWRPAVRPAAVVLAACDSSVGLHDVSAFAQVAPRLLRLASTPRDMAALQDRASHLGVGVYVDETPPRALTGPPSNTHVRDGAARWEVAELAYRHWLADATATSTTAAAAC